MSTTAYKCRCGLWLDVRTRPLGNGYDYAMTFHDVTSGGQVAYCPRCNTDLPAAYQDGLLIHASDCTGGLS